MFVVWFFALVLVDGEEVTSGKLHSLNIQREVAPKTMKSSWLQDAGRARVGTAWLSKEELNDYLHVRYPTNSDGIIKPILQTFRGKGHVFLTVSLYYLLSLMLSNCLTF